MLMARAPPVLLVAACFLLCCLSAARSAAIAGAFRPASSAGEDEYASVKDYYSKGDTSNICLRTTTVKTCDVIGLFSAVRYETGMECCDSSDHNSYYTSGKSVSDMVRIGTDAQRVGKCTWRLDPFLIRILRLIFWPNSPIPITDPLQVGSFEVQCEFNEGAEACGDGCTDGLRLEAKGPIWYVPKAAIPSLPKLQGTTLCAKAVNELTDAFDRSLPDGKGLAGAGDFATLAQGIAQFMPRNPGQGITPANATRGAAGSVGRGLKAQPQQDAAQSSEGAEAELQYEHTHGRHHEFSGEGNTQTYYEAEVLVAYGHVEVTSSHSGKKYDEGFLQTTLIYDVDYTGGEIETMVPDSNTLITEPYRMDLTLKGSSGKGRY